MKYNSNIINLEHLDAKALYFVGDIHGEFQTFRHLIKQHDIVDAIIVLCGDIGMGFYKPGYYVTEIGEVCNTLVHRHIHVVALRGNHDDPKYFTNHLEQICPQLYHDYPNWIFAEDYDLILTKFGNILCIGGGVSVDRTNRLKNFNQGYWEGENVKPLSKRVFDRLKLFDINIVASHDAPTFTLPFTVGQVVLDWQKYDKYVRMDCEDERLLLQDTFELIKENWSISDWYYGHFHDSYYYVEQFVRFHGLNCKEFKEFR